MSAWLKMRGWKIRLFLAVLGALVVLYPLSYGPWLAYGHSSRPGRDIRSVIFTPVYVGLVLGPDWLIRPYVAYLECWNSDVRDEIRSVRRAMKPGPTSD